MTVAADPGDRGRLDIAPSVLRKVVEHAADHVPGTLRVERRVAGIDVGASGATAMVAVRGAADDVDVRLELVLGYPGRVRAVVDAVRAAVAAELERITGYRMRSLAVTVTGLRALPRSSRLR